MSKIQKQQAFKYIPQKYQAVDFEKFPVWKGTVAAPLPLKSQSVNQVKSPASDQKLKIWHWNVNGLRTILKKNKLQEFLENQKPQILCLNETKIFDNQIGQVEKHLNKYFDTKIYACGQSRANYGGVAIFYNKASLGFKHESFQQGFTAQDCYNPDQQHDEEALLEELNDEGRLLKVEFEKFILVSVYTPHSGVWELARLDYRVNQWDRSFEKYLRNIKASTNKEVIVCGDLNIIRHDWDIYNRKGAEGRPALTEPERQSFDHILKATKLEDAFRMKYPYRQLVFSHWTDRCGIARKNNWGSRLDYFLVDRTTKSLVDCKYHHQIEGSDHSPVSLTISKKQDQTPFYIDKGGKQEEEKFEEIIHFDVPKSMDTISKPKPQQKATGKRASPKLEVSESENTPEASATEEDEGSFDSSSEDESLNLTDSEEEKKKKPGKKRDNKANAKKSKVKTASPERQSARTSTRQRKRYIIESSDSEQENKIRN